MPPSGRAEKLTVLLLPICASSVKERRNTGVWQETLNTPLKLNRTLKHEDEAIIAHTCPQIADRYGPTYTDRCTHMRTHTHTPILATSLFTGPSTPIKSPVSPSKPDHRLPASYHTLFTDFITEREHREGREMR